MESRNESPEVYKRLRTELAPWFKASGFKRGQNLVSWHRESNNRHTYVWCQISQDGWDQYAGSKFVFEFQRSAEPDFGSGSGLRKRLAGFLTSKEREDVRRIQNEVIGELILPPENYYALHISESVTKWYLANFEPVLEPYSRNEDIWLRYRLPEHLKKWTDFIIDKLPACIGEVENW